MKLKSIILLVYLFSPILCVAQQSPLEQVENYLKTKNISEEKFIIALNAVSTDNYESARRKLVREDNLEKLEALAKNNIAIAKEVSYLLAISSEEAVNNAEIEKSRKLYEYSNKVFTSSDLQRDIVLSRVNRHPLFQKKPEKKKAPKFLIFLIIITAGTLWIVSMLAFYKKRAVPDNLEARDSAKDLMSYFNLSKNSSLNDLNKNYRALAKSVHPDTAGEEFTDEFQLLKDKFEKAKEVLFSS